MAPDLLKAAYLFHHLVMLIRVLQHPVTLPSAARPEGPKINTVGSQVLDPTDAR